MMGIKNVKAFLWGKDIANIDVIAKAFEEFARPDGMPESSFKIGDFVQVIAPDSHREGECGEIVGRMHSAVGWIVKFARYDPRDNPSPSTVKLFHGLALREDQIQKEP